MKVQDSFSKYLLSYCSILLMLYTSSVQADQAWVDADILNLRAKPSPTANKVKELGYNTQCEVLKTNPAKVVIGKRSGQWANVKCAGKTGWVFNAFLADHDLFVSRADALLAAIKAKKPLASFVAKGGFNYDYSGSDRCEGTTGGELSLTNPATIDKPFKVKLSSDGKGWLPECSSAKTYQSEVLVAKEAREFLKNANGDPTFDSKALTASIETEYGSFVFQFKLVGNQFMITKINHSIEDPG
jgi:hypothetical protein